MSKIQFKHLPPEEWQKVQAIEGQIKSPYYCACQNEEQYRKYLTERKVMLIMQNQKAVGTLSYKIHKGTKHINGLVIAPEHQGKGLAKAAMQKLLAETTGPYSLYVHPHNSAALCIYLKLGFQIDHWSEAPFKEFGDKEPRLFLNKTHD